MASNYRCVTMRVAIVGSSGSGKSTLARSVSERTGLPHVELDAIQHLPGWKQNPHFVDEVAEALECPDWVVDGNYSDTEHLTRGRADIIAVFDLPRWRVMSQVIRRTLRRAVTREVLWNGNREPLTNFYRWDPEVNVIRWSWTHYHPNRLRYIDSEESGRWDHAEVVWFRSHADADAWLETLPRAPNQTEL